MAKMKGGEAIMGGGAGMSPRKAMAGAAGGEGNFGVESFDTANRNGGHHPDHAAGTGGNHLADGERGIGEAIHHTKGHLPAQAAPNHGPHHPDGYMAHHTK